MAQATSFSDNTMIDNLWFDTLQKTFSKMHFSWKLSMVLNLTFLMGKYIHT